MGQKKKKKIIKNLSFVMNYFWKYLLMYVLASAELRKESMVWNIFKLETNLNEFRKISIWSRQIA